MSDKYKFTIDFDNFYEDSIKQGKSEDEITKYLIDENLNNIERAL